MDVVFQAHNAVISDHMRLRASRGLGKLARRLSRPVDALIRFNQDGPTRRVEITLHAAGHRHLVAEGEARFYGPALNAALGRLAAQVTRERGGNGRSAGRGVVRA